MTFRFVSLLSLSAVFFPGVTSALTLVQIVGLFHIAIGILLTFTLGIFAVGIGLWVARFNTWPSHRDTAIGVLRWSVALLFILVLLVALVQFIQHHSRVALAILAFIAVIAVLVLVVYVVGTGKESPKGARSRGGPPPRR